MHNTEYTYTATSGTNTDTLTFNIKVVSPNNRAPSLHSGQYSHQSTALSNPKHCGVPMGWTEIGFQPGASSYFTDADGDDAMAILRDLRTGQVRAILRDLPAGVLTRADAVAALSPPRGLDVLFSRGLPGGEGWRR